MVLVEDVAFEAATGEEVLAHLFDPAFRANPYPYYARLHELGPVHRSPFGFSVLVSYRGATTALKDLRLCNRRTADELEMLLAARGTPANVVHLIRSLIPFLDPPDHTRLRSLVNKAFLPRAIADLAEPIARLTKQTLDDLTARGPDEPVDTMLDVAHPVPIGITCEMLDIPIADRHQFKAWSDDIIAQADFMGPSAEVLERAEESAEQFTSYVEALITDRRRSPGDDLLSALLRAEEAGDRLTYDEVISLVMALLLAGNETTVSFLANATLVLATHADQRARLVGDPTLLRNAIEELLRYDSPTQFLPRTATEDVDVCGLRLAEGERLMVGIGAANHDPTIFDEPGRLDLGRPDVHPLSFGHGIHYCFGAALARSIAHIYLPALFGRFPSLALAGDIEWRVNFTIRSPATAPLTTGPAA